MNIEVNKDRCPQNHRCPVINVCPVQAIDQNGYSLPVVDQEKCITCMKCFSYCPMGAFEKV